MTATQLAERVTAKVVATKQQTSNEASLARLEMQRDKMVFKETSEEAVRTAERSLATLAEQVSAERARGGCKELCRQREADERAASAALLEAQGHRASTIRAAELDAQIKAMREAITNTDGLRTAAKQADPQSANMAKVFGVSEETIALIGHLIFAVGVEIGSGLLPWLLFASAHGRNEEPTTATVLTAEIAPVPPTPLPESPDDIRRKFFNAVVIPSDGDGVSATTMHLAYSGYCMANGYEPMPIHQFGLDPPWQKRKTGGRCGAAACRRQQCHVGCLGRVARRGASADFAGAVIAAHLGIE